MYFVTKNAQLSYNKRQKICLIFLVITQSVIMFHEISTNIIEAPTWNMPVIFIAT